MKKRFYRPGRLYFFPALLPFVEIVPWLITLISTVVAAASFSLPIFLKKRKKVLIALGMACCLIGGYAYTRTRPTQINVDMTQLQAGSVVNTAYDKWTRLVEPEDFPVVKIHNLQESSHQVLNNSKMPSFQKKWHHETDYRILSRLLVHDKAVIYGSYWGSIEAVSAFNGSKLWSLPLNTYTMALTQDEEGNVYAGEGLHETSKTWLTSFNVIDKTVNWQREFAGHIEGLPVVDKARSKLWVPSGQGGLWALNKEDGAVILHLLLGHIDNAPLVYKDRVYAQAQKDEKVPETMLYALSESDGSTFWEISLPGKPWGTPQMDKNEKVIYTTTAQGQLGVERLSDKGWAYAVLVEGKILWQKDLPDMAIQPTIYLPVEGVIIYTIKTGEIVALDTKSGDEVWQAKAGKGFMSPVYLISGFGAAKVAGVTKDGQFFVRDAKTGKEILGKKVEDGFSASPVVDDDTIYVPGSYEITAFGGLRALWGQ